MGIKTIKGKKVPIGSPSIKSGGPIVFYDVGQRGNVTIPRSDVKSVQHGSHWRLTAKSPNLNKAGGTYNLHKFSGTPA